MLRGNTVLAELGYCLVYNVPTQVEKMIYKMY